MPSGWVCRAPEQRRSVSEVVYFGPQGTCYMQAPAGWPTSVSSVYGASPELYLAAGRNWLSVDPDALLHSRPSVLPGERLSHYGSSARIISLSRFGLDSALPLSLSSAAASHAIADQRQRKTAHGARYSRVSTLGCVQSLAMWGCCAIATAIRFDSGRGLARHRGIRMREISQVQGAARNSTYGVAVPLHRVDSRTASSSISRPKSSSLFIDGPSLLYPRYYAAMKYGAGTKAADLFMRSVMTLCEQRTPDYVAVAFDTHVCDTWRAQEMPEYKATRTPAPKDLLIETEKARSLLEREGFHSVAEPSFEADDIIATWTGMAMEEGLVTIVSEDKDLCQLVRQEPQVEVLHYERDRLMNVRKVKEIWGVRPDQFVDLLALVGDASDNVKGVPGIGRKTGASLLQHYDTLEGVLQAAMDGRTAEVDGVGPKRQKALQDHADDARKAQKLCTLVRDIETVRIRGMPSLKSRK